MPQWCACSLQTDSFYTASVCSLPVGEDEEEQRGGRREGWENKASIVVSPAGPGRAALAGASYVMWLAGPTSLFRAAAHNNPHWGTSPALEEEEEIEGELQGGGSQWRRCDYRDVSLGVDTPNRKHRQLPSQHWRLAIAEREDTTLALTACVQLNFPTYGYSYNYCPIPW